MASIHDDLHEGIDENFEDTLVDEPNQNNGSKNQTVVNSSVGGVIPPKNEDSKLLNKPIVPGQPPELDVQFNLISEHGSKVIAMKDVEADILGLESISVIQADDIENTFGSFFGPRLRRAEFTSSLSKTNYNLSKSFMATAIASESARFISGAKLTSDAMLAGLKTFADSFNSSFVPSMEEKLSSISSKHSDVIQKALCGDYKDVVFFDGSKNTINVLNTPIAVYIESLDTIDFSSVPDSARTAFCVAVTNLHKALTTDGNFRHFFKSVLRSSELKFGAVEVIGAGVDTDISEITAGSLFRFFSNSAYPVAISALQSQLENAVKFYTDVNDVLNNADTTFEDAVLVVDKNAGAVSEHQAFITYSVSVAQKLATAIDFYNGLCGFFQQRLSVEEA